MFAVAGVLPAGGLLAVLAAAAGALLGVLADRDCRGDLAGLACIVVGRLSLNCLNTAPLGYGLPLLLTLAMLIQVGSASAGDRGTCCMHVGAVGKDRSNVRQQQRFCLSSCTLHISHPDNAMLHWGTDKLQGITQHFMLSLKQSNGLA